MWVLQIFHLTWQVSLHYLVKDKQFCSSNSEQRKNLQHLKKMFDKVVYWHFPGEVKTFISYKHNLLRILCIKNYLNQSISTKILKIKLLTFFDTQCTMHQNPFTHLMWHCAWQNWPSVLHDVLTVSQRVYDFVADISRLSPHTMQCSTCTMIELSNHATMYPHAIPLKIIFNLLHDIVTNTAWVFIHDDIVHLFSSVHVGLYWIKQPCYYVSTCDPITNRI